jgi:hypothetical protein
VHRAQFPLSRASAREAAGMDAMLSPAWLLPAKTEIHTITEIVTGFNPKG